jgi:replicative superfamily II helicase
MTCRGTKRLNPMQSEVYEVAYKSAQNMLVCAPTGAGKTNVAMLTLLQLVSLIALNASSCQ